MCKSTLFITLILLIACSQKQKNTNQKQAFEHIVNIDTCYNLDSFLIKQADSFKVKEVSLASSINQELDSFLLHVDTNCLRKQNYYQEFITIILAKLSLYHLQCCNQGYDLYQMQGRSAQKIVHEFEIISGYKRDQHEMLTSGILYSYILGNPALKDKYRLQQLTNEIKTENERIMTLKP